MKKKNCFPYKFVESEASVQHIHIVRNDDKNLYWNFYSDVL